MAVSHASNRPVSSGGPDRIRAYSNTFSGRKYIFIESEGQKLNVRQICSTHVSMTENDCEISCNGILIPDLLRCDRMSSRSLATHVAPFTGEVPRAGATAPPPHTDPKSVPGELR